MPNRCIPKSLIKIFFLAFWILLTASCQGNPTPAPTPTTTPTLTPVVFPTSTPTPEPLASEKNPLVLGIVADSADSKANQAAAELAVQIGKITAFSLKAKNFPTYSALLADMASGKTHLAFLPPLTYLYASQYGIARVTLVSSHLGVFQYGFRIFANVSSKFTSFYDPLADRSTAPAATALKQLQDNRPCWVEPGSPSGHVAPLGTLMSENFTVKSGSFLGSPTSVIRALYIGGICDFGATFATTGDPRTSPAVQQDLTDVNNRVIILWQSDAFIPSLNLSISSKLKDDIGEDLTFAVQALLRSEVGKTALNNSLSYEIKDFRSGSDNTYLPLLGLVNSAKIDLSQVIGK